MSIIPANIVSALNNYNSIVPIVTKDLVENGGRTLMAYHSAGEKTKKYEATEKFVEANMSSLLWYGAIPFTKKIFNMTVFKGFKLNHQISLEYLKEGEQNINSVIKKVNDGILPEKIIQKGRTLNVLSALNSVKKNAKVFKGLHVSRMLISTIIPTVLSAIVLPKAIIALTQFKVNKDSQKLQTKENTKKTGIYFKGFSDFQGKQNNNNKVSFKSLGTTLLNKASQAQTSLLGDMVAVDLAISGSRIYYANKREQEALNGKKTKAPFAAGLEKLIREGGFLYLIYFGGNHIKNGIDKLTKNNFDPLVLEDKNFVSELKDGKFKNNPLKSLSQKEAIDFIDKNINNDQSVFIKYAKKLNLIETVKDSDGKVFRNPFKYINLKKLCAQFDSMSESAAEFLKKGGADLEKYVMKKSKTKRIGVFANLIASSFAVCYILPKITYGFRKWYTGNTEEPGIINVISSAKHSEKTQKISNR